MEQQKKGELFANIVGNPEDAVYDPRKDYTITIDYKKGPKKIRGFGRMCG